MPTAVQPWVLVAESDVQACVLAEALNLAQTRALARGQADPFTVIMPKVVATVRNKVASAPKNLVDSNPLTVPPELAQQTALLIGYEIALPLSAANANLLSDDIRKAVKDARDDLKAVAEGKFAVSLPSNPLATTAVSAAGPIQTVGGHGREFTRDSLRGL